MARDRTWQPLVSLGDLEPGDATPVTFQGRELAVFDGKAGITVAYARCTHGAANLCDGYFDGHNIECPLHQGLFDAQNGKALAGPARTPLRMLEARIMGDMVEILI